jgi:TetR/AcrR family transcriptional regulator, repressor of fatR-cypB operon
MARQIDETKMDRIRDAALQLVVENGYGGASISMIASKAGVAEGYLYRFYSGKQELITSLLYSKVNIIIERIETLLSQDIAIKEIVRSLFDTLGQMAIETPEQLKFIHVLMHDYSFQVSEEQRSQIKILCEQLRRKGISTNEIRPTISNEDIFMMMVIYPIELLNLKFKKFLGSAPNSLFDAQQAVQFSLNALK